MAHRLIRYRLTDQRRLLYRLRDVGLDKVRLRRRLGELGALETAPGLSLLRLIDGPTTYYHRVDLHRMAGVLLAAEMFAEAVHELERDSGAPPWVAVFEGARRGRQAANLLRSYEAAGRVRLRLAGLEALESQAGVDQVFAQGDRVLADLGNGAILETFVTDAEEGGGSHVEVAVAGARATVWRPTGDVVLHPWLDVSTPWTGEAL